MARLGERLLLGRGAPFLPREGIALLNAAANRQHGDAAAQLATLAAAGAWMPQDWSLALDFLLRAAIYGSVRARAQLLMLATDHELATAVRKHDENLPDNCWQRLSESVELAAWKAPSPGRASLCESPRIRLVEAFASAEICKWLINCARNKLKPAMMYDGRNSNFSAIRTNSDFFFDIVEADLIVLLMRERMSAQMSLPVAAMEPPQILHYAIGQELKPHYDHVRSTSGYQGERIATFLLYLNDNYSGGELDFPKLNVRAKAKAGDAIYFANVDASGSPDLLTLHAGLPLRHGEKWVFSQWVHDRTFTGIDSQA